jgi:hypothetical protein
MEKPVHIVRPRLGPRPSIWPSLVAQATRPGLANGWSGAGKAVRAPVRHGGPTWQGEAERGLLVRRDDGEATWSGGGGGRHLQH